MSRAWGLALQGQIDQQKVLCSLSLRLAIVDELEKLRSPLSAAVSEEVPCSLELPPDRDLDLISQHVSSTAGMRGPVELVIVQMDTLNERMLHASNGGGAGHDESSNMVSNGAQKLLVCLRLNDVSLKSPSAKYAYLRKHEHGISKSVTRERVDQLINRFAQKLDPIDWKRYEPYLWENDK